MSNHLAAQAIALELEEEGAKTSQDDMLIDECFQILGQHNLLVFE